MVLLLAAFTAAAVAFHRYAGSRLEVVELVTQLKHAGSGGGAMPALAGLYLLGTTFFFPAVAFHVAAAATWGFLPGLAFSLVVANAVSNLQFWVGRWAGRERVRDWLAARGHRRVLAELEGEGLWAMLIIRQLPLPFAAVNAAAGASPMPWWHFLVGSGLGLVPGTVVYTYFAAALVDGVAGARGAALGRAAAAGLSLIALGLLSRALRGRWARRQRTTPT